MGSLLKLNSGYELDVVADSGIADTALIADTAVIADTYPLAMFCGESSGGGVGGGEVRVAENFFCLLVVENGGSKGVPLLQKVTA